MIYELNDKTYTKYTSLNLKINKNYIGVFSSDDFKNILEKFNIPKHLLKTFEGRISKFESYENFDIIAMNLIDYINIKISTQRIFIYIDLQKLLIFCNNKDFIKYLTNYIENEKATFGMILYHLFKKLTSEDLELLNGIEREILAFEDNLLSSLNDECIKYIIKTKHKLLSIKGYYEGFYNILDGVLENKNKFFDETSIIYFKILSNKIDRLNSQTTALKDYTSQVREAYQAQVDISLNKIMKIFTVITAIMSPLTLIVGWYGMNLNMPEYNFAYSYPIIIFLSLSVIILCIIYFKKNKWF